MDQRALTLWWIAGAVLIGLALPLAAVMMTIDHRRHRHWPSTALAIAWCALALGMVGALQGNLSPPMFGVPLALLYALAWTSRKTVFAIGVGSAYCLGLLVVVVAALRQPTDVHWWFLLAWPASFLALMLWRVRRPSAVA